MDTYLCGRCFNTIDLVSLPLTLQLENQVISDIHAAAYYEGVIQKLIHTYKYEFVQGIGTTLAHFIYYTTTLPPADYITAVPLHPKRLAERGFNQAELVAQELSKLSVLPYLPLLQRIEFKTAQAKTKDRADRIQNILGQFQMITLAADLKENEAVESIQGKAILLFDDVCTTGATLNECARVLLAAGAKSVTGLVIAHGG